MTDYKYDLVVIGAGSGGIRASRMAAELGATVAIVEENALGGTCVNLGCIPKKLFVYASQYQDVPTKAAGYGWQYDQAHFDWEILRRNKDHELARLNENYRRLLTEAGVHVIDGRATILDPHQVKVGDALLTTNRILLTVGGAPYVPEFPGNEFVLTSNDVFSLEKLPRNLFVVGGGYIGVEFAGIFNGFGVETHLCHRGQRLLNGFDADLGYFLGEEMARKGVRLHLNTDICRIERAGAEGYCVSARDGRQWETEMVMYATGRRPSTAGLGLENTQITLNDDGTIPVNDFFQTIEPSIYALGDAVGRKALTPIALAEAEIFVQYLYGGQARILDYDRVPTAVFSQPALATLGLTEDRARELYKQVEVYRTCFRPLQFSLSASDEKVLMKLVVDGQSGKVLGCHMVGPEAPEIIQGFAVAMTAGATKADFDKTLGVHPTLAEEFVTLRSPIKKAP